MSDGPVAYTALFVGWLLTCVVLVYTLGPSGWVAVATGTWFVACFALIFVTRNRLGAAQGVLYLPTVCLLFVAAFLSVAGALVMQYREVGVPLVSPFSTRWFSAGWNRNLVFMGVRIDTPLAYALILNYQVTRCILGALLSNAFQPYLQTLLSQLIDQAGNSSFTRLLLARAFCDVTGFVTSLTDLILYVSQVDIFVVSGVVTISTNWFSSWLVLRAASTHESKEKEWEAEEVVKDIEGSHARPLGFAAARRLRL
jgi:hypothetical protein